jgi:hypothetical protein
MIEAANLLAEIKSAFSKTKDEHTRVRGCDISPGFLADPEQSPLHATFVAIRTSEQPWVESVYGEP